MTEKVIRNVGGWNINLSNVHRQNNFPRLWNILKRWGISEIGGNASLALRDGRASKHKYKRKHPYPHARIHAHLNTHARAKHQRAHKWLTSKVCTCRLRKYVCWRRFRRFSFSWERFGVVTIEGALSRFLNEWMNPSISRFSLSLCHCLSLSLCLCPSLFLSLSRFLWLSRFLALSLSVSDSVTLDVCLSVSLASASISPFIRVAGLCETTKDFTAKSKRTYMYRLCLRSRTNVRNHVHGCK